MSKDENSMSAKIFSLHAELLWEAVPAAVRSTLLCNVWCGQCRTEVEIVDYAGKEKAGDLILEGRCAVCAGRVARFIETSERRNPLI
jgi:hypothetical protein